LSDVMTNAQAVLQEAIQNAYYAGQVLRIRGGATKMQMLPEYAGEDLDTRSYHGIIAYDPAELVITARAGTTLNEIETCLEEQGQMLAFEPPHFGDHATLGGMIACGFSGPRRASHGAMRDFVLGVSILNGKGEYLRFGGQVIKNVAGYDVSRLMVGARGELGLILDVSLKVLPKPKLEKSLMLSLTENQAIAALQQWALQGLPISGSVWHMGCLILRLSGAVAAVTAAQRQIGGQELPDARSYWMHLREQAMPFFKHEPEFCLWRLSVPAKTPAFHVNGKTMFEWGGAQRWLYTQSEAQEIIALAQTAGGYASMWRPAAGGILELPSVPEAQRSIQAHIKQVFDPAGIFNQPVNRVNETGAY